MCPHLTERLTLSLTTGWPRPSHTPGLSLSRVLTKSCAHHLSHAWLGAKVGIMSVCVPPSPVLTSERPVRPPAPSLPFWKLRPLCANRG